MKRIAFPLAAAALLLASCSVPRTQAGSPGASPTGVSSSRPFPSAKSDASATTKPSAPAHEEEKHDESEPHDGSLSAKYSKEAPPPDGFRPADTGDSPSGAGRVPLEMRTRPGCVEVGGSIEVTLRTKPDMEVGILSNIPAEEGKAREYRGRSDGGGLFTKVLAVPSGLRPGNYDILSAAADDRGDDGGRSGSWFVVVAEPGGCR